MLVSRRSLLKAAAAAPALSLPGILRAQSQTTLRFIPVIDLTFIDPIYATAQVSRNHGFRWCPGISFPTTSASGT